MKNLKELFMHHLQDLYSAEDQLTEALPKMVDNTSDEKLKRAFENHLEETKQHKTRLEQICDQLGIDPNGEKCKAMEGLIKEAEDFLKEVKDEDVKHAGMIADAQRVEHYEISGYGTLVRFARELGQHNIAEKLQTTLKEEYYADDILTDIAENRLNKKAS